MMEDLRNMDQAEHPFSIVAIKDSFNKHPNRFLLYHDQRWECDFFFSFRTLDDEQRNMDSIREHLSNQLKVDLGLISLSLVAEEIHSKYSKSDKVAKRYRHKLYLAVLESFGDEMKHDSFTIEGTRYKWMTVDGMTGDPAILGCNMDVVSMVKNNIP